MSPLFIAGQIWRIKRENEDEKDYNYLKIITMDNSHIYYDFFRNKEMKEFIARGDGTTLDSFLSWSKKAELIYDPRNEKVANIYLEKRNRLKSIE